ncbi:MAG TPA: ABC transporter substrate-binding protein [Polyangia bacterium]|jgi:phospholipid transport system substrate-binding protein
MPATLRLALGLALGLLLAAPAAQAQQTPQGVLKKANGEVEKLVKKKAPKGSPAEKKLRDQVKAIVGDLIDYDELAQQTMSRHWGAMTAAQKAEFTKVFRDLIERNYAKQISGNVDYKIDYKTEKVSGDKAQVRTIIHAKRKGRMADTIVDYKMLLKNGAWKVYDIITDEDEYSSLVVNYRSEFNKIWNKDGFAGVMNKMRKKLKEIED